MKIIRRKDKELSGEELSLIVVPYSAASAPWKVLIVDDEPDVHTITKLSLKNFSFADKPVEFLHAMSGMEAREIIQLNPDIAAVVIDVVMETEDAGLLLVKFIREELKNRAIRLVIRTGQPGVAPERFVIDHYDIDDYKDKTELVAQKLYTTIRSAIKAYRDISIISRNREGLEKILNAAPQLYRFQPMKEFFEGVLMQIIGLCHLGDNNLISVNGFIAIEDEEQVSVQAGTGRFAECISHEELKKIKSALYAPEKSLPQCSVLIPLKIHEHTRGFIYLEDARLSNTEERRLIEILVQQCATAFENLDLYRRLEAANKLNEKKNQFLGMAAHDLRNPLGNIRMLFEMIRMTSSDRLSEDDIENLNMGAAQVEYAITLVSDLLDIARIESGKMELSFKSVDLSDIISQSISANHFLSESKHITVVSEERKIANINADVDRLLQVFTNLISNALKYSYPNTVVRISVSQPTQHEVLFSIKDQGQGIPADDIGKLFQPFVKAKVRTTGGEESTGLGLMICKKIVEAHGGRIWVKSEIGDGSTFFVVLPVNSKKVN